MKGGTALSTSSPLPRKVPVPRVEPQTFQIRTSSRQKDLVSFHRRGAVVWRDPGSFWYSRGVYGGLQDEKRRCGGKGSHYFVLKRETGLPAGTSLGWSSWSCIFPATATDWTCSGGLVLEAPTLLSGVITDLGISYLTTYQMHSESVL